MMVNMCLCIFAFFATLSCTIADWDHGYFNGRIQRHHDFHKFGHMNYDGYERPHPFPHHPREFGMHPHPHTNFNPPHGFGPNFDHPHNKFDGYYENCNTHDKFGQGTDNFDGSHETSYEDQSNNFVPDNKDSNSAEEDQTQPKGPTQNRPFWNGQRWVFPDMITRPQTPSTTTTRPRPTVTGSPWTTTTAYSLWTTSTSSMTSSSASPLAIVTCMRRCPVTSEYNPVCGSNNITYNNVGRLECAKNCGVDVTMSRASSCSSPTPASQPEPSPSSQVSTNAPTSATTNKITPTRFTTIDVNGNAGNSDAASTNMPANTIPRDVIDNIFYRPTTPNTTVDDGDIDIRHED